MTLFPAICAFVVALSATLQSVAISDNDWKRWLVEVGPLLTAAEKADAAKVPIADRETFREAFWARRDPNGAEPGNAHRAEFEQRVRGADKRLRDGGKGKWNDCGRAFVLLGPPDRTTNSTGDRHLAAPDRLADFREQDDVPAETWFYRNPPRLPAAADGYAFRFTRLCESVNGPSFDRLLQTVAKSFVVER